jgi:hypothetical protein
MHSKSFLKSLLTGLAVTAALSAQTTIQLPDSSQSTTLTAAVTEQAQVQVPSGVTFNVTNIGAATAASAASVSVAQIVTATATKQLKISVQAGAAAFTPPVVSATTWSASDVTWNAATWTSATGASGTLSSSSYNEVATCAADSAACSTTGLVFTLGSKTTVKRSGNHTLNITWKFESIGT